MSAEAAGASASAGNYGSKDMEPASPGHAAPSDALGAAVQNEKTLAISLQHRHAFGLKTDTRCNVHYAEENQVIYPAGNNTVLFNTEDKSQKFFSSSES